MMGFEILGNAEDVVCQGATLRESHRIEKERLVFRVSEVGKPGFLLSVKGKNER
jgi:hypothetical protein